MAPRKQNGLVLPLPPEIQKIFKKVLTLLESERVVRPVEYTLIAQLAQAIFFNAAATHSLMSDGLVLTTTSHSGGTVSKMNPAVDLLTKTTSQIVSLSTKLGVDQKAFNSLGEESGDDEDDPIADALAAIK